MELLLILAAVAAWFGYVYSSPERQRRWIGSSKRDSGGDAAAGGDGASGTADGGGCGDGGGDGGSCD